MTDMCPLDPEDILSLQASFCVIFQNVTRLKILNALGREEKSVGDIAVEVGASLSSISQHLRLMKDRRLVAFRKVGQKKLYRITHENFLLGPKLIREGIIAVNRLQEVENG